MQEPNISVKTYVLAYIAMMVLFLVNIGIAFLNLGWANMFIGLVIALAEVALLALVLMQAYYEKPLVHLVIGGAILWFLILVTLTFNDYITRNWLPVSGK